MSHTQTCTHMLLNTNTFYTCVQTGFNYLLVCSFYLSFPLAPQTLYDPPNLNTYPLAFLFWSTLTHVLHFMISFSLFSLGSTPLRHLSVPPFFYSLHSSCRFYGCVPLGGFWWHGAQRPCKIWHYLNPASLIISMPLTPPLCADTMPPFLIKDIDMDVYV